jgi:3'-phosphoadenosine 5'-phosphosulfate sulfotransferase (PAPS reductase)/FAD synthetase
LRSEESPLRAKKEVLIRGKASNKEIEIVEWLPIHHYKLKDVLEQIKNANQELHKVYSMGFSRLSCAFCVFGKKSEHELAANLKPDLFNKLASLERELGKTIRLKQVDGVKHPKFLDEYIKITKE